MNPRLAALVVGFGAIVAGGVIGLYAPRPGVTLAELLDAGIGVECVRKDRTCQGFFDGGYVQYTADVALCTAPDGGRNIIVPRRLARAVADEDIWCGPLGPSTVAEGGEVEVPFSCACRGSVGACKIGNPDGGVNLDAPFGRTLRPGTFGGAGCIRKPCFEVFGGPSAWPAGCPL